MATRRMIDPQFWQSETVGRWTFRQRLLFIGLFSNADDQGRLRAHPALIRSTIFPYDDIPLDEITSDLEALTGSVILYSVDGKEYCQIAGWWKFQCPQWAYPSKIPPLDGWKDRMRFRCQSSIYAHNWHDVADSPPEALAKAIAKLIGSSIEIAIEIDSGIEEHDSGADAPEDESQKQASDEKPEKPKQELSPLARHFKALWGVKFINSSQLEVIGEMEKAYPYDRVVEASKWAHKNNMPLGKALSAIETALPKWGQKGANGNVGKSNGSHSGRVPQRNPEYKVAKASDFDPIVGDGANAHGP